MIDMMVNPTRAIHASKKQEWITHGEKSQMSVSEDHISSSSAATAVNVPARHFYGRWQGMMCSPLWICLLLAVLVRAWLVVHTHGVVDGDEAIVGIQAQHILRGERPIYYYGQAYMGSLEAYLMALLFAIAGSSAWTLRAEPLLLSLVVVGLTWKMAGTLADSAHLSSTARHRFQFWAALFAALPPLYDAVIELRTLGGYIETFVLMLLLLISTLRLIQRWSSGISQRELVLRWAGIGFVVGLGLWVDPLISSAIAASAIWIAGYGLVYLIRRMQAVSALRRSPAPVLKGVSVVAATIGAGLVGCAPALYWGASNGWANVQYILNAGAAGVSTDRYTLATRLTGLYITCIAPRVVGGSLPVPPGTAVHWHLLTLSVLVGIIPLLAAVVVVGITLLWRQPVLLQYRQLVGLPLVFGVCSAALFCVSKVSVPGLYFNCLNIDNVGRFASPLLLALPFFFAALLTMGGNYLTGKSRQEGAEEQTNDRAQNITPRLLSRAGGMQFFQIILLGIVVLYLGVQGALYVQSDGGYTFQTSGCTAAPANNDPIITYLRDQHIHYVWASFWIGNPIMFKSGEEIIAADPRVITDPHFGSRLPANTDAVLHSDRPSVLTLVLSTEKHPQLLKTLDAEKISWRAARFPSEPGFDLLVVTPLNSPISPFTDSSLGAWFAGC